MLGSENNPTREYYSAIRNFIALYTEFVQQHDGPSQTVFLPSSLHEMRSWSWMHLFREAKKCKIKKKKKALFRQVFADTPPPHTHSVSCLD